MLVMQYRRMLVVSHDIVVGHLLLALFAGLEVAHLRLVFGRSAAERREGGQMAARPQLVRPAQAFELVRGLDRPIEVQPGQQVRIILGSRRLRSKASRGPDECHAAELGPFPARRGGIGCRDELDILRPGLARQARRLVPVVVRLMKQHPRPGPRCVDQHALGIVDDRHPGLEMRIYLVGVALIVQELDRCRACMNDQGVEFRRRQRAVRPPHHGPQVVLVERIKTDSAHAELLKLKSLQRLRPG